MTAHPYGLTRQQAACLDAIVRQGTNRLAAAQLGLSLSTLENHLARARLRLRTRGVRADQLTHVGLLLLWMEARSASPL